VSSLSLLFTVGWDTGSRLGDDDEMEAGYRMILFVFIFYLSLLAPLVCFADSRSDAIKYSKAFYTHVYT
jgi:hypothetical protein